MNLEERAIQLGASVRYGVSVSKINSCTDFAIDANRAGRADLSIAVLKPLSVVAASEPRIWQLLALAYRDEQQSENALAAFSRAAAQAPRNAQIAAGHASVTLESGAPSALLFKRARDLAPNDPELLLSAVTALSVDGHPDVAEIVLARTVAANPAWVRGHEALAARRLTMTGADDFARTFADGCADAPMDLALRLSWQRSLTLAKQFGAAQAVIDGGRSIFGALLEFDAAEANVATECGDDERAEALFTRAMAIDDPGTKISHIRHCLRTGRIEQADGLATAALQAAHAASVWPYMSIIWRLLKDDRAIWLDGAPPMIATVDLDFTVVELDGLADTLRRLHTTRYHPAGQSLRGGTQSEGALFSRVEPELQALRSKVVTAVRTYVDKLPAFDAKHPLLGTPRNEILFSGSWTVRLRAQGFHIHHTHPFGWISSALYVALPSPLTQGATQAGRLQLGAPPPDLRVDLPAYATIEPKPGRLVLFPSTMWHATLPFDEGERLTVAFDVATPRR